MAEIIPYNFDEIYGYIEQKFKDKGYDIEEGSNTMQLVTAMSYLTSMLNANTAININETLLTNARKRSMILRDARVLGYEIAHKQSFKYKIAVIFSTIGTHTVVRYTEFTAGDYKYYYLGDDIQTVITSEDIATEKGYCTGLTQEQVETAGGTWNSSFNWGVGLDQVTCEGLGGTWNGYFGVIKEFDIVEGKLYHHEDTNNKMKSSLFYSITDETYIDSVTGLEETRIKYYVDVPIQDIEENGLDVFLSYIDTEGDYRIKELWSKTKAFVIDNDTVFSKEYLRLDDIDYRTPRIYFKIGNIGKAPRIGTAVHVNALQSSAPYGDMLEIPTPSLSLKNVPGLKILDCEPIAYKLLLQGADEESSESIRQNARMFSNTANRVITRNDYITFCNRQTAILDSEIWDGNNEYPTVAGHIWFSFLPSVKSRTFTTSDSYTWTLDNPDDAQNWYVETAEIDALWKYIDNFKVPTLVFHHHNPVFFDFYLQAQIVKYTSSISQIDQNTKVFDIINEYFTGSEFLKGAETFNFEYIQSNLIRKIDTQLNNTGINLSLITKVTLSSNNIIKTDSSIETNNGSYHIVRLFLGYPYENIFDNQEDPQIIVDKLPTITGSGITIDPTPVAIIPLGIGENLVKYNLMIGAEQIGEYRVFNLLDPYIEVRINVISPGFTSGLDLSNPQTLTIEYKTPNIQFTKNTIPRLRSVEFI